jgi:hypothetical protein
MSRDAQTTPDIGLDTPLRLIDAARIAFPAGGMTVSGLRKERNRNRLVIEKIAGKEFTTLRNIAEMRVKCREARKEPDYGSSPKSETQTAKSSATPAGSLETERAKSALAALEQTAKGLSKPFPNTSPKNTRYRATADVIPLKS